MQIYEKTIITRDHYDGIVTKLVRVNGMAKIDAICWADKKFIISSDINTIGKKVEYQEEKKKCKGCQIIWDKINKGHDGYFTCPDCGKDIEWGT